MFSIENPMSINKPKTAVPKAVENTIKAVVKAASSKNNNLNTIQNLDYSIDSNIIKINHFDTLEKYNSENFYLQDLKNDKMILEKNMKIRKRRGQKK